eukprot:363724-Chlamydomonas_euryale.AAC.3
MLTHERPWHAHPPAEVLDAARQHELGQLAKEVVARDGLVVQLRVLKRIHRHENRLVELVAARACMLGRCVSVRAAPMTLKRVHRHEHSWLRARGYEGRWGRGWGGAELNSLQEECMTWLGDVGLFNGCERGAKLGMCNAWRGEAGRPVGGKERAEYMLMHAR